VLRIAIEARVYKFAHPDVLPRISTIGGNPLAAEPSGERLGVFRLHKAEHDAVAILITEGIGQQRGTNQPGRLFGFRLMRPIVWS
jgi:hypothetical protein